MGRYILTKKELIDALKKLSDSDFIMVNLDGHTKSDYPITHIEDSTSVGFWELRCDSSISFWEALKQEKAKVK